MLIAIRNATGIDLHLAIVADGRSIRIRITLAPPVLKEGEVAEKLRAGEGHGIAGCPDGLRVKVDASATGMAIRAITRREMVDRIGDDGELDGEELYLELTLRLMN